MDISTAGILVTFSSAPMATLGQATATCQAIYGIKSCESSMLQAIVEWMI